MIGSVIALLVALFAVFAVFAGAAFANKRHWVQVTSGGTATKAVFSTDAAWTAKVIAAINDAIASR